MKRSLIALVLCALGVWGAAALVVAQGQPVGVECSMGFEAAVRQGPAAGLVLLGDLNFAVDASGSLEGAFVLDDGQSIPTFGQVNGRAIHLVFDLGDEQYVYGTGTALEPIVSENCGAEVGGTFAGPGEGDLGDWRRRGKPKPEVLNLEGGEEEGSGDDG